MARLLGTPLTDWRRALARHRVLLAAGLAAASVASALSVLAPPAPPTALAVVAVRDLGGGRLVTPSDVTARAVPAAVVPGAALTTPELAVGRTLAAPVRRGEILTDVRLVGPALVAEPGLVATPVRIGDAGAAGLLSAGDSVDVLAASTDPATADELRAEVVAGDVRVLAVPASDGFAGTEGALVLLATTRSVAARLATAAVRARLSVVLRP